MVTILAIGAIQSLFFSLLLLTKKHHSLSDRILQYWLLVLFLHIGANLLELMGYYERYPHLMGSSSSLVFLYGPLLYFYAKAYVMDSFRFRRADLWHLLPFLLYNLALIPFYIQSASEKQYYYQEVFLNEYPLLAIASLVAKTLTIPVYLVYTLILLGNHRKNIAQYFSDLEKIDLRWLNYLVWSMVVVWIFVLVSAVVKVQTNFVDTFHTEQYIFSAATLWVLGIGYYGLKQTPVFTGDGQQVQIKRAIEKQKKKKPKPARAEQQKQKLLMYMEQQQPYLRNKLTLHQLAEEIEIPPQELSQLLNEVLDQNFFNFINDYRVEEVKTRLQNPEFKNLTILGIALDCGFSSKAAFNRIFKTHTGLTPTAYLKGLE